MGVQVASLALQSVPVSGPDLTWLTIFVGIIAVCVLGITLGLVGALIAVLKVKSNLEKQLAEMKRKAEPMVSDVKAKVDPIIGSVRSVVEDLQPKIKAVTDDLQPKIKAVTDDVVELSHMVRAQATDLDSTLSDATQKARSQVDRVNGFVSSTLDTTATVASNLEKGIRMPIREIAGLVNGVKAGVESLFHKREGRRSSNQTGGARGRSEYGEGGFGSGRYGSGRPGSGDAGVVRPASGQVMERGESFAASVSPEVERQVHAAAAAAERDAAERAREGQAAGAREGGPVLPPVVPDAGTATEGHALAREAGAGPEVVTGSLPGAGETTPKTGRS